MTKTYEEMLTEFKTLMRCQLIALPKGIELYEKILPQRKKYLGDFESLESSLMSVLNKSMTTVDCWCHWEGSKEGHEFWKMVDIDLQRLIKERGTPWLTSPFPTFIEVDE
jgi:hypothetical protein